MAYEPNKLSLAMSGDIQGDGQMWIYKGTDAAADVDAAGYFTDGEAKGMKVGDMVWAYEPDGTGRALMAVSAISSGAATVVDITT